MKKIGLFFGSFNPVHIGHLIIANYFTEHTPLDEVWWVVSPQSPFKQEMELLDENERLKMVTKAIQDYPKLKACSIEFELPPPQYTIVTLNHLKRQMPQHDFSLLMGLDNLATFSQWKGYATILENYPIRVYPRKTKKSIPHALATHPNVTLTNAPEMDISASDIRAQIRNNKNVKPLLPLESWRYLKAKGFYVST